MTSKVLPIQDIVKTPGDDQTYSIDLTLPLNGRTISSADSVASPSGITVANPTLQAAAYTTDDDSENKVPAYTVAANMAVTVDISSGQAGKDYLCSVVVTASDSKTLSQPFRVLVRDGSEAV